MKKESFAIRRWFRLWPFWGVLLLAFVGMALTGPPSDPDVLFTTEQLIGSFFIFASFLGSLVGWGYFLSTQLFQTAYPMAVLALGSSFLAFSGFVLGHCGWIGFSSRPWILSLLFLGPGLTGLRLAKEKQTSDIVPGTAELSPARSKLYWIGLGSVVAVLATHLIRGFFLQGDPDPLIYHLTAPRVWVDLGRITLFPDLPSIHQASWWEMLYVLIQVWVGGPEGTGLFEAQLISQWTHVGVGLVGSLMALYSIFTDRESSLRSQAWIFPALLACLLGSSFQLNAALAKNDWGVIFWLLAAIYFCERHSHPSKEKRGISYLWSGIFFGMAVTGKWNSLFFVAVYLGVRFLQARAFNVRCVAGILLGALPMVVANLLSTGNPLFPFISSLTFPDLVSPDAIRTSILRPSRIRFNPVFVWGQFRRMLDEHWIYWGLVLFPLVCGFTRTRKLREWMLFASISAFGILLVDFPFPMVRWVGLPLLLSGFLTVLLLHDGLSRIRGRIYPWLEPLAYLGFLIFLIPRTAGIQGFNLASLPSPSWLIRDNSFHLAGDAKAWLRLNADWRTPVVTTGEQEFYYLSSLHPVSLLDNPRVNRQVDGLISAESLVSKLHEMGFKFILDSYHPEQRFWTFSSMMLQDVLFRYPDALVYSGRTSQIIDIQKVMDTLHGSCGSSLSGAVPGLDPTALKPLVLGSGSSG